MTPLTDRQRQVLDAVVASVRTRGYPPTLREICAEMGFKSTRAASDYLWALQNKGWIRLGNGARAITLLQHTYKVEPFGTADDRDGD